MTHGDETDYADWGFIEFDPDKEAKQTFNPYPHQRQSWRKLEDLDPPVRGILSLPTGAGKTFTATHWCLSNVLSNPNPRVVLWIAHRAELLQQAAESFYRFRGLARRDHSVKLRCISGAHGKPVSTLVAPADIVLVTIQSLSRRPDLVDRFLDENKDCFIVIDEAHHAAAKSYKDVLSKARRYRNVELLGLTATPTRTIESECKHLIDLFKEHRIIHSVAQTELIDKEILARPICSTVKTDLNFDKKLTQKELKHIQRFGDLPQSMLQKIAKSTRRNRLIANQYKKFQSTYGPTLIFANNIPHCVTQSETLKELGIKADYVASVRHDKKANTQVLQSFKDGEIDVLVSVLKLTEGVDLPNVDTVFLTRPTGSEILLRQMIGRALRGPKAGGSPEAHIVSFSDHWEHFPDWLDPISLIDPDVDPIQGESDKKIRKILAEIPWEVISAISEMAPDIEPTHIEESVPIGWYVLSYRSEMTHRASSMIVYEHHQEMYERFLQDTIDNRFVLSGPGGPKNKYFADAPEPRPSNEDLHELYYYVRDFGRPKFINFAQRDAFTPSAIASESIKTSPSDLKKHAQEVFDTTLAQLYYGTFDRYLRAVLEAQVDAIVGKGFDESIDKPKRRPRRRPAPGNWPLARILDEVSALVPYPKKKPPQIRWSKRRLESFWGVYQSKDEVIIINRALKTSDIARSTIEFLVYHELLHHVLGVEAGHSREFREIERLFPGYADANAELDTFNEKFSFTEPVERSSF